jgi:lycopene beta-cyclase
LVVDARGPERRSAGDGCGFQKFVGLELEFSAPHGLSLPIVMDATVPQLDGYRFFYVLPLGAQRLLVEDTRFSSLPELDRDAVREQVRAYAARFGTIRSEVREEYGVLPMPFRGEPLPPRRSPLLAGYRGGFFHPATGYSFQAALRIAHHIGTRPSAEVFDKALDQLFSSHVTQARYAQRLNWLLFNGFEPGDMWNVFERFYRLPDNVIHRFYAMTLTTTDRARILIGRPPAGFKLGTAFKSSSAQLEQGVQAALSAVRARAQPAADKGASETPEGGR